MTTQSTGTQQQRGALPHTPETHQRAAGVMKFKIGQIYATPGAIESEENLLGLLQRHVNGDFGDLCDEDWESNLSAIRRGSRIFSAYKKGLTREIWIITEADRSCTTILLPEEY